MRRNLYCDVRRGKLRLGRQVICASCILEIGMLDTPFPAVQPISPAAMTDSRPIQK